jgi:Fe-S cluster assembly scaffold protein SufB
MKIIEVFSHEQSRELLIESFERVQIVQVLTGVFHKHDLKIMLSEGAEVEHIIKIDSLRHGVMSIAYTLGRASRLQMRGNMQLTGKTQLTVNSIQQHTEPAAASSVSFRVVVADAAVWHCTGSITIAQHAQGVDASFSNPCLILDSGVVNTQPIIEVRAHKVRCAHGAASGRLDDEALLYLQRRGMSLDAARKLLIDAFLLQ